MVGLSCLLMRGLYLRVASLSVSATKPPSYPPDMTEVSFPVSLVLTDEAIHQHHRAKTRVAPLDGIGCVFRVNP